MAPIPDKVKKAQQLDNARALYLRRKSSKPEVQAAVDHLLEEMRAAGLKNRRNAHQLQRTTQAVLLDLLAAHKADPSMYLHLSLNKNKYNSKSRYSPDWLSYRAMKAVIKHLEKQDYIEKHTGFYAANNQRKSRQTRIRAKDRLIKLLEADYKITLSMLERDAEEEVIIMRDKDKNLYEYDEKLMDTDGRIILLSFRGNLQFINECLERDSITLDVPDEELKKINRRLNRKIDFTQKYLRRVFNNCSWEQGGRFYGGWWQNIPSEYRHFIRIDGKHVAECDFAGLHINMLYADRGLEPPEGDVYYIDGYSNDPTFRNFVKRMLLIMVNARNRNKVRAALHEAVYLGDEDGSKLELPKDIPSTRKEDLDPLMDAFERKHEPIKKYFSSGAGNDLQYIDSSIAERVMLYFAMPPSNEAVLPVHDSFIVRQELEEELIQVMKREYRSTYKTNTRVETKYKSG